MSSAVKQMLENDKIMSDRKHVFNKLKTNKDGIAMNIHNVISDMSGKVKQLTGPVKVEEEEMKGGKRNKKRTNKKRTNKKRTNKKRTKRTKRKNKKRKTSKK